MISTWVDEKINDISSADVHLPFYLLSIWRTVRIRLITSLEQYGWLSGSSRAQSYHKVQPVTANWPHLDVAPNQEETGDKILTL